MAAQSGAGAARVYLKLIGLLLLVMQSCGQGEEGTDVQMSLKSDNFNVVESKGSVEVCVILTASFDIVLDAIVRSSAGSAISGVDYREDTELLTLRPGTTEKCTNFVIINDSVVEGNETFSVTLEALYPISVNISTAVVTIIDDDTATATNGTPFVSGYSTATNGALFVSGYSTATNGALFVTLPAATTAAASLFPSITSPPSTQVHSRDAALYIGVGVGSAALLVLIVVPVIVISLIICLRKKQDKLQLMDKTDTVNVTDNVAYGTTKGARGIELSGNIAYATTNFRGIDSAYDYVTITGKNDINSTTFTNETNVYNYTS